MRCSVFRKEAKYLEKKSIYFRKNWIEHPHFPALCIDFAIPLSHLLLWTRFFSYFLSCNTQPFLISAFYFYLQPLWLIGTPSLSGSSLKLASTCSCACRVLFWILCVACSKVNTIAFPLQVPSSHHVSTFNVSSYCAVFCKP